MKLTRYRNCKPIEIDPKKIVSISEGVEKDQTRDYPYSDVQIFDRDDKSGYTVRVVESRNYILKMAEKETDYE